MRLHVRYEPRTLDDVVGQDVRFLKALLQEPHSCCVCVEGVTGTGKSAATGAFLRALKDRAPDPLAESMIGHVINGPDFDSGMLEHLFGPNTPFRFRLPENVHYVVLIEELEWMHPQAQRKAKDLLWREVNRRKLIVLATSNDLSKLGQALRSRFQLLHFSGQREFATAANERIAGIWEAETGGNADLPPDWRTWGWEFSEDNPLIKEFSMRRALNKLEQELRCARVAA